MNDNRLIYTVMFHFWRLAAMREGRVLEGLTKAEQAMLKLEADEGLRRLHPMVSDALEFIT